MFGNPGGEHLSASLQLDENQTAGYDYLIDVPGNNHTVLEFGPEETEITVPFTLQPDEMLERNEYFRASVVPEGFSLPISTTASTPAFANTLIMILDTDCM